jgi:hypothetical protein
MFIVIEHDIHDPAQFQESAKRVFPIPKDLRVHMFLPTDDLSRATCLYEGPSVQRVREHLDTAIGRAATQRYYPVAEAHAIGLPTR